MNLAELRDTLNEVKDKDRLEQFSVTPKLWGFDDPEAEIGVHFYGGEGDDDWDKNMEMYNDPAIGRIVEFLKEVEQSVKTSVAASLDDTVFEVLCEQEP